ncbi:DUF3037 domain-containing protein [Serratia sp. CY81684]|uniref:DUF3037 domain-containing protein n=1 Tax=Serratia TaxID=613 RepID=UPI0023800A96|nr:DUF3037 domain-containing protein [Serratia marcescens]
MTTPCLYSIVRYAPYAETEEFANVGVVLCAPKAGFFDFKITKRNDARVKCFFHDDKIFPIAKTAIGTELKIAKYKLNQFTHFGDKDFANFFRNLTARKESIFHFSQTRVVLSQDPATELVRIYDKYVNHSTYTEERREDVLAKELKCAFDRVSELRNAFKPTSIKGNLSKFTMPLVAKVEGQVKCAIKPLAFTQDEPGKMMEHGDAWIMRITRASEEGLLSADDVLFTLDEPMCVTARQKKALDNIKRAMDLKGINHIDASDKADTINFAKRILHSFN